MNVSQLIAAEAYFFSLDSKEAKDQDRKKLPPTGLYLWPAFLSGHRSLITNTRNMLALATPNVKAKQSPKNAASRNTRVAPQMLKHLLTKSVTKPRVFFGYFLLRKKKVTSTDDSWNAAIPNKAQTVFVNSTTLSTTPP
jgi:hypothetical protein